jgi:hypothetical protein
MGGVEGPRAEAVETYPFALGDGPRCVSTSTTDLDAAGSDPCTVESNLEPAPRPISMTPLAREGRLQRRALPPGSVLSSPAARLLAPGLREPSTQPEEAPRILERPHERGQVDDPHDDARHGHRQREHPDQTGEPERRVAAAHEELAPQSVVVDPLVERLEAAVAPDGAEAMGDVAQRAVDDRGARRTVHVVAHGPAVEVEGLVAASGA